MPNKVCKTCEIEKPIEEFYKQTTRGIYGVRGTCKLCDNQKKKSYRESIGALLLIRKRAEYSRNKIARLKQKRKYRQENKGLINALVTARKKVVKQRIPSWVDAEEKWLIKEVYQLASFRSSVLGFPWHVDHVIPLQGTTVSGLHTLSNLQVIPAVENIKKRNKVMYA